MSAFRARVLAWIVVCTIGLFSGVRSALSEVDPNIIESFPIDGTGDDLLIPVTIKGHTYAFTVDTGCSTTIVDSSLRHLLKESAYKSTWNGKSTISVFELNSGSIGKSRIRLPEWVYCFDLSDLRTSSGNDERGIIGMDVLQHLVLQLNFDEQRMLLLRSSSGSPGRLIPITKGSYDRPAMTVTLPGLGERQFLIDTGSTGDSNGSICVKDFEILMRWKEISHVKKMSRATIDGRINIRTGILRTVALDEWHHEQLEFNESTNGINLVGLGYLSRFNVTLDFRQGAAFFAKGTRFDRHFHQDPLRDGITLGRIADKLAIVDIDRRGRGYLAGLRKGDQIVEIAGRPTDGLSVLTASRIIYEPNADLDLTIVNANVHRRIIHISPPAAGSQK